MKGRKLAATLLGALAVAGICAGAAQAQDLKPIKFGLAAKTISPTSAPFAVPEYLGYFKEEGLTVEVVPLGSNAATAAAAEQGRVDILVGVPTFHIPLLAEGKPVNFVNYYEYTYPFKWAVAVKPGSDVRSLADLKGKNVGVSNFGTTDFPMGKRMLALAGLDPENDATWLAVGDGATAGHALTKGDIDALVYYDTGFGTIEAAGIELQYLPLPPNVPKVGGVYLSVTTQTFADPEARKALVGFARAVAKATIFINENPEAAAYALIEMYPEIAPRAASMEEKVASVALPLRKRAPIFFNYDPSVQDMGAISPAEIAAEIEFMDLSDKLSDASALYRNDLIKEINDFDKDKIREEARNFKLPYKS